MSHCWKRPYHPTFQRRTVGGSNPSGGIRGGDNRHPTRIKRRRAATHCECQPETRNWVERVHRDLEASSERFYRPVCVTTPRRDVTPRGVRPDRWRCSRLWQAKPLPMGSIAGKSMGPNVSHCTRESPPTPPLNENGGTGSSVGGMKSRRVNRQTSRSLRSCAKILPSNKTPTYVLTERRPWMWVQIPPGLSPMTHCAEGSVQAYRRKPSPPVIKDNVKGYTPRIERALAVRREWATGGMRADGVAVTFGPWVPGPVVQIHVCPLARAANTVLRTAPHRPTAYTGQDHPRKRIVVASDPTTEVQQVSQEGRALEASMPACVRKVRY